MKKILTLLLILFVSFAAFAEFKPYLLTLDLHPGILGGWIPTYAGVGGDAIITLKNGDKFHLNTTLEGGLQERALFQDAQTGHYIENGVNDVQLFDVRSFSWGLDTVYSYADKLDFSFGYKGVYEVRKNSMFFSYDFDFWPQSMSAKRWLGGKTKTVLNRSLFAWADGSSKVFPEFDHNTSLYTIFDTEAKLNLMRDTMVANDGLLAKVNFTYVPGFLNRDASLLSTTLEAVLAKAFVEKNLDSGKNAFAISIIDRANFNFTFGKEVSTYFQQSISLGRKVRGFDAGSYARQFTFVNNFDVRFSGIEALKGVFPRTNYFFDFGFGFGNLFNTKAKEKCDLLMSMGIQEQIDICDNFDFGVQVAYLLCGKNVKRPNSRFQTTATFFLDF